MQELVVETFVAIVVVVDTICSVVTLNNYRYLVTKRRTYQALSERKITPPETTELPKTSVGRRLDTYYYSCIFSLHT
jgi:hypothetical protein